MGFTDLELPKKKHVTAGKKKNFKDQTVENFEPSVLQNFILTFLEAELCHIVASIVPEQHHSTGLQEAC